MALSSKRLGRSPSRLIRVRFPVSATSFFKSITCKTAYMAYVQTVQWVTRNSHVTLYRRHSERCPVHKLKVTPAAKRKYMDCDARCGSTGYRNDSTFPSEHRNEHYCGGRGAKQTLLKNGQDQKVHGPRLDDCIERSAHRAKRTRRKNRRSLSFPARSVARLLRNARRSLYARDERRSPRRLSKSKDCQTVWLRPARRR